MTAGILASRDVRDMWHDPERPFLMTRAALRRYVEEGDWVLLFNALTLYTTPLQSEQCAREPRLRLGSRG